ncbi:MAG TPA: adenylate/guanylate cyclase domain-containing protein [Thermoanaerobaculia bacterium]|nr:adenylate/guanylate cyclase domain-containing protein [Thermoanaerobaculia bacterium]HUM29557.1 adenylate/guanylate cyclase domain-containing protein [Thermoanaerobaculia bacterium]HXK67940.1 adenylate/guanylate cyclase domain-containing protein [Thermoanaerobaculia bacterium]
MNLSPFLPLTLRSILEKHGEDWPPQFLIGTTLFADISGFTQLSEALTRMGREGSEYLTRILNETFTEVIDRLHFWGGDVMRFAGDAVTVFFPESRGEQAAIHAALDIQSFMKAHPEVQSPVGTFPIRIKIGIASGTHTLMMVGQGNTRDYVFAGEPVDGSAEAEHHAEAGDVILHPTCHGSGGTFFKVKPRTPASPSSHGISDIVSVSEELGRPFLHPALSDKILSGHAHLMNEHRKASILFVSFGAVSDYMNIDELTFLQDVYSEVRQLIDHYDGYINKVDMGDKGSKFLITFGVPRSHEDDGERAVGAAEDLMELSRKRSIPMAIGINTGVIFSGILGSQQRCEFTVMGDDVNLAARLMQLAERDRIVLSEGTKKAAPSYSYQALPPTTVKGKKEPISIFIPQKRGEGQTIQSQFFVGRTEELRNAIEFLDSQRGQPALLGIQGEAGIGKSAFFSRLSEEFDDRSTLLFGHSQPFTSRFPFHPWKKILFDGLNHLKVSGAVDPAGKWPAYLKDKYPDLLAFAPLLLDLLNIPHSLPPIQADDQTRKSVMNRQVQILLNGLAEQGTTRVVLNNTQWIDTESIDLIRNLLRIMEPPSPAFILLGRSPLEGMETHISTLTLLLSPLNREESLEILEHLLGTRHIPEKLLNEAMDASHGHPLLLRETIRTFSESGYIARDADHPEILFLDETRRPSIPATLEDVVMARFDRLSANNQALLKKLSVLGDNIPPGLLKRVISDTSQERPSLEGLLIEGEFISRHPKTGHVFFVQNHIRSTIYDSLDFGSRRDLHRLAAHEFDSFLPRNHPDRDQILAFHYMEARDFEGGCDFIIRAAQKAYVSYAFPTAVHYAKALLDQESLLLQGDRFTEMAYTCGDALIKMGRFPEVLSIFHDEFISRSPEGDGRARLLKIAADAYRLTGNFPQASESLEDALTNAEDDLQTFRVLETKGTMLAQTSRFEEAMALFTSLTMDYRERVSAEDLARTATVRGPLLFITGQRNEAFELLEHAKETFINLGEIATAIRILNNMGSFLGISGEHEAALEALLESLEYQEKFGIQQYLISTINEIGTESMLLGKWKDALYHFKHGLSLSRRFNDPLDVRIYCNLSELYQYCGRYKDAMHYLQQARESAERHHFETIRVTFYWVEFLSLVRYSSALLRMTRRLEHEIEQEKANYLKLLCDSYRAHAFYLTEKREEAASLASEVLENARRFNLKKEAYLATRTLFSCTEDEPVQRDYIKELKRLAAENHSDQFSLETLILELSDRKEESLIQEGDAILGRAPFAHLAWIFHLRVAEFCLSMGNRDEAASRISRSLGIYNFLVSHSGKNSIGSILEHSTEANLLHRLISELSIDSGSPPPELYSILD